MTESPSLPELPSRREARTGDTALPKLGSTTPVGLPELPNRQEKPVGLPALPNRQEKPVGLPALRTETAVEVPEPVTSALEFRIQPSSDGSAERVVRTFRDGVDDDDAATAEIIGKVLEHLKITLGENDFEGLEGVLEKDVLKGVKDALKGDDFERLANALKDDDSERLRESLKASDLFLEYPKQVLEEDDRDPDSSWVSGPAAAGELVIFLGLAKHDDGTVNVKIYDDGFENFREFIIAMQGLYAYHAG